MQSSEEPDGTARPILGGPFDPDPDSDSDPEEEGTKGVRGSEVSTLADLSARHYSQE